MQTQHHDLGQLFQQLGLPSDDYSIEHFIESQKPLASTTRVTDLDCFSRAQKSLLLESLIEDSDWAEAVDTLDALLHQPADIRPS